MAVLDISWIETRIIPGRLLTLTLLLVACATAYCVPAFARGHRQTKPQLSVVSFSRAANRTEPTATEAAHFTACPDDPGGAFYNVHVKLVSCARGEAVLHHNGHGYGFRCHTVGYGVGGGFPAYEFCGRRPAAVSGGVLDGQSTS